MTDDLIGLPWTEAEPRLGARGITYETLVTGSPRAAGRPVGRGELRVIGVRPLDGGGRLLLILAHQEEGQARAADSPHA